MDAANTYIPTCVINWEALGVDPKIIVENCERVPGRFVPTQETTDEPCAVVAYGPSLAETWRDIAQFRTIFTCSGAYKFLVDRGINPTVHCESDPRGHKVDMLGTPHRDTTFRVASVIHSNYLDYLEAHGSKIELFHILFDEDSIYQMYPKGDWVIAGGSTIGPRTIKIARLSGFTNLHLFGFDGSGGHAGVHTNAPPASVYNPMVVRGTTYSITENLLYQTGVFFDEIVDRLPEVQITMHGDGLIQQMFRERGRKQLARWPLAIQK